MKQLLLIGLALILSACNTTPSELEDLDKVLRAYEHSMRWSRLELVGQYYKEPPEFTRADKEHFKNIKVTGYKVLELTATRSEALQLVEIRYYHSDYAVEREFTDTQKWEYDDKAERWALTSRFPEFK